MSATLSEKDNSGCGASSQMTVDFPANKKLKEIASKVHNDERQRIKKRYDSQDCFNLRNNQKRSNTISSKNANPQRYPSSNNVLSAT